MQNMDRLPAGAMQPLVRPINVDDVPIMTLTLSSTLLDDFRLREVAQRVLEQLRNVPGDSSPRSPAAAAVHSMSGST